MVNRDAVAATALVITVLLRLARWEGKWLWLGSNLLWFGIGSLLLLLLGVFLGWVDNTGGRVIVIAGVSEAMVLVGLLVRASTDTSEDENRNTVRRRRT